MHEKDICLQYDSWNQKPECCLAQPQLEHVHRVTQIFCHFCACLQMTMKESQVLTWGYKYVLSRKWMPRGGIGEKRASTVEQE